MRRVPVSRKSAAGLAFAMIGAILLCTVQHACAEPITLDAVDGGPRVPAVSADPGAISGAPSNDPTDESGAGLRHTVTTTTEPGETSATARTTAAARPVPDTNARRPLPPGANPPPDDPMRVSAGRGKASPPGPTDNAVADDEPEWERELKEAVRPIYDELTASGVVDAVQGFKAYLAMLGVITPGERSPGTGQRTKSDGAAESRGGSGDATWETRAGYSDPRAPGHSNAQIEKERLIGAIILEEWLAAATPWIYSFIALFVAWQIVRLVFALLRARTKRAQRRAARSSHRTVSSARARARS